MKKFISFILSALFSAVAWAQGGVDFQHLTLDEALAKAKAENKLVFVDCYTSWCGPCKYMTTTIFPKEEAGAYFNARFVCVKFDMEKGEGKELKKKFGVKAYPTFLMIRPDGTVQHRVVGGGELDEFIARVEKGLKEKTSLHYLSGQYAKGKMKKQELILYKNALDDAYDQEHSRKISQELLAQLTDRDKLKKDFWPVFEDESCVVGSADFNFLLKNLRVFEKNMGKEKMDAYLYRAYNQALMPYIQGKGMKHAVPLAELKRQLEGLTVARKGDLLLTYGMAEAVASKNLDQLFALIEPKTADLKGAKVVPVIQAFSAVRGNAGKADFSRMQAIVEKLAANPENAEMGSYLAGYAESFKKSAHVGVYFEDLTFEEALKKAKAQHKMLFIDCYTSWCGPCKYMSTTIFPMEKMGDFMNPRFVSVKYDMEKGEGPALLDKFGVQAFPTFVILNPDGTVRHILVGSDEADSFIERVKEAFDDDKATGVLDAKYAGGNRDKEFMLKYVNSLSSLHSPKAGQVAGELFGLLSDSERLSGKYWFIFSQPSLSPENSEAARYLLANRSKFNEIQGKPKVDNVLSKRYQQEVRGVFNGNMTKTVQRLDQIRKEIVGLKLDGEKSLLANVDLAKAIVSHNPSQIMLVCEKAAVELPADEVPYLNASYFIQDFTPAQQARWIQLGKKLQAKCKDVRLAANLGEYVKYLEKQAKK